MEIDNIAPIINMARAHPEGVRRLDIAEDRGSAVARVVVPEGVTVADIDLEQYQDRPFRKRAEVVMLEPESLVRYVNQHKCDGKTAIFANVDADTGTGRIIAVLDYHETETTLACWGEHTVRSELPTSPEWDAWRSFMARGLVTQGEFAEFLEEMLPDVVEDPSGLARRPGEPEYATANAVFAAAMKLQLKSDVAFRNAVNLDNGNVRLEYTETTEEGTGEDGNAEVPKMFVIRIPIYRGAAAFYIRVRLKYRLERGAVRFSLRPIRMHRVISEALADMLRYIEHGRVTTRDAGNDAAAAPAEVIEAGTGIKPLLGHVVKMDENMSDIFRR